MEDEFQGSKILGRGLGAESGLILEIGETGRVGRQGEVELIVGCVEAGASGLEEAGCAETWTLEKTC